MRHVIIFFSFVIVVLEWMGAVIRTFDRFFFFLFFYENTRGAIDRF